MKNRKILALIISMVLIFTNSMPVFASATDATTKNETSAEVDESEPVLTIGADGKQKDDKVLSIVLIVGGFLIGSTWSRNAAKKKR